jgi:hypothetical protein
MGAQYLFFKSLNFSVAKKVAKLYFATGRVRTSVSNPVYTDTGVPVFGTPNTDTDTGKSLLVLRTYKLL